MKSTLPFLIGLIVYCHCNAQKEFETYHGRGTMYVNKNYNTRSFSKLLVVTGTHDKETNQKIIKEFQKIGVNAVNSLDLISPVDEYTDEELSALYRKNSIDGIITAEVKDESTGGSGVPHIRTHVYEMEITLFDLQSNLKAVTFIGRAQSTGSAEGKAIHKFFRAIMEELQPVINL